MRWMRRCGSPFISELVPVTYLPNAIAMGSLAQNLGRIIGPALGGVVIAVLGVGVAYFINALTFMAALAALSLLRTDEFAAAPHGAQAEPAAAGARGPVLRKADAHHPVPAHRHGLYRPVRPELTTMLPLISTYWSRPMQPNSASSIHAWAADRSSRHWFMTRAAPFDPPHPAGRGRLRLMLTLISFSSNLLASSAMFVAVVPRGDLLGLGQYAAANCARRPKCAAGWSGMINLLIPSPIGPMLTGAAAASWGRMGGAANGLLCLPGDCLAYITCSGTAERHQFRICGAYRGRGKPRREGGDQCRRKPAPASSITKRSNLVHPSYVCKN